MKKGNLSQSDPRLISKLSPLESDTESRTCAYYKRRGFPINVINRP